jgi:uncharacterized protein YjbI with pentapeptide repeats
MAVNANIANIREKLQKLKNQEEENASTLAKSVVGLMDWKRNINSRKKNVNIQRSSNIAPAKVNGAVVNGAKVNGAVANGAKANGEIVNGAKANGAVANGAVVNGAKVNGAVANGAVVNGAKVNGAKVNGAVANGAVVNGAKVNGAVVDGAKVNGAVVDGAKVNGAVANGAVVNGATEAQNKEGLSITVPPQQVVNEPNTPVSLPTNPADMPEKYLKQVENYFTNPDDPFVNKPTRNTLDRLQNDFTSLKNNNELTNQLNIRYEEVIGKVKEFVDNNRTGGSKRSAASRKILPKTTPLYPIPQNTIGEEMAQKSKGRISAILNRTELSPLEKFLQEQETPAVSKGGSKVGEYITKNGHRYKVRTGSKGGKYIVSQGKKVYV